MASKRLKYLDIIEERNAAHLQGRTTVDPRPAVRLREAGPRNLQGWLHKAGNLIKYGNLIKFV